jgi:hypothetical protein
MLIYNSSYIYIIVFLVIQVFYIFNRNQTIFTLNLILLYFSGGVAYRYYKLFIIRYMQQKDDR